MNFTKTNTATIRYTNSQWLREDATEASVGRGRRANVPIEALFATRPCLRTICSRGCRAKPGRKLDHKPCNGNDSLSFGTRPCPKSASVEGRRAEDRPEVSLCHARMPLRYLWGGSPCQSAGRSPLCHARMPLRHLWVGFPCQRPSGNLPKRPSGNRPNDLPESGRPLPNEWQGLA